MRRKRKRKTKVVSMSDVVRQEPPSISEEEPVDTTKETIPHTSTTEVETLKHREVYEDPKEEEKKLLQKSETILAKLSKEPSMDDEYQEEEKETKDAPTSTSSTQKESEASIKESAYTKTEKEEYPSRFNGKISPTNWYGRNKTWIWLMILVFLLGGFLGLYYAHETEKDRIQRIVRAHIDRHVEQDLSLHHVQKEDVWNDVHLVVKTLEERVDGLYVTFEIDNQGTERVYVMANAIKLVDKDGNVVLPDSRKGEIPSSLMGFGISPDTKAEGVVVFKVSKDFQASYLLLENVTNLKNPTWTFRVNLDR